MSPKPSAPRQQRSKQTVERLLTAAEELFGEVGQAGFTIPEVSRRAGISVGTVYRRYATKEDLLVAVLRRVEQQEAALLSLWDGEDWSAFDSAAMIERLVGDLGRAWHDHAPTMRAMMARRFQMPDDQVFAQGLEVAARQSALFRAAVMTHQESVVHPAPEEAVDFAYRLIVSVCARWTARAIETRAPRPLAWGEMLARLSDTVTVYLFGRV